MKIEQKIPEGWSVKKLGDIAKLERGKFSIRPRNDPSCYGGSFPFVQTGDITRASIYLKEFSQTLNDKGLSVSKLFPANVILITIAANIGETAITTFPVCCPDSLVAIRENKSNLIWLNYILETHKNELNTLATQNAQKNINLETLKPLKILTPPLPEQEKIAGILSCWDDGIEKLSALIEKKKIQKKALMQQLLTGKHRLKGFSSPWHEVKLKDVLYEHKETSKGDETICSVSVHKGIISQIEHLGRSFAASNTSNYNLVHYGDVVYTKSPTGEFPYGIFKQSQQRTSVIVSPLYGVFTPKTYYLGYILDVFFSYAINLNNYLKPIIQKGAKNTINITNETFLSKAIFLPEETTEIQKLAEIFIKADEEIELLNKKLEAFKQEKKALMQQLLTGKIRVKVN